MSTESARGPGGLVLHEAGMDPSHLDLSGGPAEWTRLPAMGLRDFVDEHLRGDDAKRVCIFLDAPHRTTTRIAAALGCARSLMTLDRNVVVVDGDDQQPDLSEWSGRLETEGWVDMVRYGFSTGAASVSLPWGPMEGRVLGVGSYHPVRAEKDEIAALVKRLHADYDTVLVCASTGDRGAFWSGLDAVRVMCWDRSAATVDETAALVRDANDLGAPVDATIAFGVTSNATVGAHDVAGPLADEPAPRRSSPIFRRLAVSLTVLVIVLGSWILGQLARQDETPVALPEQTDELPVMAVLDTVIRDTVATEEAAPETVIVAGAIFEGQEYTKIEEEEITPPDAEEPGVSLGIDWSVPVEEGVFCLHVFSMADRAMAQDQLRWMDRQGVKGLVRPWSDGQEKVWYRIYAGSFATLADARAALPDICERLDTDWAQAKRTDRIR